MLPEPVTLLWVLGLWAAVTLLVPKRDWRTIRGRLRDSGSGRRSYLFGPPLQQGAVSGSYANRLLDLTQAEWPRVLELGLPLYLVAVFEERRGQAERRAVEARWMQSPSAALLSHLHGDLSGEQLLQLLSQRGFPRPAGKAEYSPPRRVRMPPIAWRIEWEKHLAEVAAAQPPSALVEAQPAAAAAPVPDLVEIPPPIDGRLEIQTLGSLHLRSGEEDLGPELQEHPILSFIWLYLLARAAIDPEDRISRAALADEVSPGIDSDDQRERLRGRLRDLRKLPAPISGHLDAGSDFVRLDLSRASFDVRRLLDLARECERSGGLISQAMVEEIHQVLASATGEFLPDWDELERQVTRGRGVAGEVVGEVRHKVEDARIRLVAALGDCYLAKREPNRAIPPLEEALRRQPDREDLALKLIAAYDQASQPGRAAHVRKTYGFDSQEPVNSSSS